MNHVYDKELYLLRRRSEMIEKFASIVDQEDFDPMFPDPEIQDKLDKIVHQYKDVMTGPRFIKELKSLHAQLQHGCNNDT